MPNPKKEPSKKPKLYTEAYLTSAKKKAYEQGRADACAAMKTELRCFAYNVFEDGVEAGKEMVQDILHYLKL